MGYEILEHTADVGVRGTGPDLGAAFAEAARGMFSLMIDLRAVAPVRGVQVDLTADTLEGLLVAWLGELLAQKDIEGLVFSRFSATVTQGDGGWALRGQAHGEPLDVRRHQPGVEVKAATYYGVRVAYTSDQAVAQCVLDL